jgi:hypothetical protein
MRRLLAVFVAAVCPGCATFVTYSGPALPDVEVVLLRCPGRFLVVGAVSCRVSAVDGLRPGVSQVMSRSARLAPGRHWVEFTVERYLGGSGGTAEVCALDLDFTAGLRYDIEVASYRADIGWVEQHGGQLYGGSVNVRSTTSEGVSLAPRVALTCSFGGGSLCRASADCAPHPDIVCHPRPGYAFGQCGFR